MQDILIEEKKESLGVNLNSETGVLVFEGHSYPENSVEFFEPIQSWLTAYFQETTNQKTTIDFEIIYFNSSSSRSLYEIFTIFNTYSSSHEIEINWIYVAENDFAEEIGEDFIDDYADLTINLIIK